MSSSFIYLFIFPVAFANLVSERWENRNVVQKSGPEIQFGYTPKTKNAWVTIAKGINNTWLRIFRRAGTSLTLILIL